MKKKLLAKMAVKIFGHLLNTDGASDCTYGELAHDALMASEEILEQIDEKYPDEDPFIKPVDEVFDADLKRVFGGSSEKIPDQDSFNNIADLRPFLLRHPSSNMVTMSCLHYLGDDAQKWWEERTNRKNK